MPETLSSEDLAFLQGFLLDRLGHRLDASQDYVAIHRLSPLAAHHGCDSLATLVKRLRAAPASPLARDVCDAMSNNETYFFRDPEVFTALTQQLLPALRSARPPGQPIRIWCAACSTGQEPYSIAIGLLEAQGEAPGEVEILASDGSEKALAQARNGIYNTFEIQRGLAARQMVRHFQQEGAAWVARPPLRARVAFRQYNLLQPPPYSLGEIDIVLLRNALIYFDDVIKRQVLDRVRQVLVPDGYLILGGSETALLHTDKFIGAGIEGCPGIALCKPAR